MSFRGTSNPGPLPERRDRGYAPSVSTDASRIARPLAVVGVDLRRVPRGARTRFAPAPTGFLHLGHLVNAALVWDIAGAVDGTVVLRLSLIHI